MPERRIERVVLTARDHALFDGLSLAADVMAAVNGASCEVVLHSFEDPGHSLVKIVNSNVSGRQVGSPVTDVFLQILHEGGMADGDMHEYFTQTPDGRLIRCVGSLVRNPAGQLIGLFGVNQDLSVSLLDFVGNLLPRNGAPSVKIPEHFPSSAMGLLTGLIEAALQEFDKRGAYSGVSKTRWVVAELYRKGAFEIKGSVEVTARELRVSIYTVYNYIREARAAESRSR